MILWDVHKKWLCAGFHDLRKASQGVLVNKSRVRGFYSYTEKCDEYDDEPG
jgi:hypothetical protein